MSALPSRDPGPVAPGLDAHSLHAAAGGVLLRAGTAVIAGAAVDSRRVKPGYCFFALPGEHTDGHRFLPQAIAAGAAALVVTEEPDEALRSTLDQAPRVTVVRVPNVLEALQAVAAAWRARFTPLVVGVTGSIAKTSTKEAIAETLSERWSVLRNEGNENNEVGLPLTLMRLSAEHEVAVLEMGMYVPGEIRVLAAMARPTIGVVTAVRGTHLSRAGSLDAIEAGKGELVEALPASGTAILNADDERVRRMASRTAARSVTYGFAADADVRAEDVESLAEEGMRFALHADGRSTPMTTPALGRHGVHNELAAAAVALAVGMEIDEVGRGISRGHRAPHRSTLISAGPWRILDDSYNAAPDSMAAALDLLATLPGRRVAVLGEMLELGSEAEAAHARVGARAAGVADLLISVGPGAAAIAEGATEAGMAPLAAVPVADHEEAVALLAERLLPGDVVLVKASRGVGLDRVVERLVALGGRGASG